MEGYAGLYKLAEMFLFFVDARRSMNGEEKDLSVCSFPSGSSPNLNLCGRLYFSRGGSLGTKEGGGFFLEG